MFLGIGFGFVEVDKKRQKRSTTASSRKVGEPYSTRLLPMADIRVYIYIYMYIIYEKFLGGGRPPAACEFIEA
jgi:hypothetical protein